MDSRSPHSLRSFFFIRIMLGLSHKSENVTVVVIGFGETRGHVQRELSIVLILTALSEVYEIIVFDQMYCTIYDYLPNLKHRLARKRLLQTVGEVWITELILKFQRILANVLTLVSITDSSWLTGMHRYGLMFSFALDRRQ